MIHDTLLLKLLMCGWITVEDCTGANWEGQQT